MKGLVKDGTHLNGPARGRADWCSVCELGHKVKQFEGAVYGGGGGSPHDVGVMAKVNNFVAAGPYKRGASFLVKKVVYI